MTNYLVLPHVFCYSRLSLSPLTLVTQVLHLSSTLFFVSNPTYLTSCSTISPLSTSDHLGIWWNVHADVYFSIDNTVLYYLWLQQTTEQSCKNKHEGPLPDCSITVKESESEEDLSWMHWQHTWNFCELWCESDDRVTRQATSDPGDRQTAGCTLASGTHLAGMTALT